MANQDNIQDQLRLGIEAVRRGDKVAAQLLLRQVIAAEPTNELAWMWLASAVESLTERRECLERALAINPNNARAQEALRRLSGGQQPARPVEPTRTAAPPQRQIDRAALAPEQTGGGPRLATLILVAVAALAIVAALIFGLVFFQQANPLAPPTEVNPEIAFAPTATPSPDPQSFTATPFLGVIVTREADEAELLPPTFTPTFTPQPSITPTPTATPFPISSFVMIYTGLGPGTDQPDLYRAQGDGAGEELIGADIRDAVFDPTGEQVAFVREVTTIPDGGASGGSGEGEESEGESQETAITTAIELFVAPIGDLEAARQLTTLGGRVSSPTWAPDGIRLAFVSDFDGDAEIWTITEDGNNIRQITNNSGIDKDPVWSPDGALIAFASDQESPDVTKIFTMNPDGSDVKRLTSSSGNNYAPYWSPDSAYITFANDGNGDGDIYIMEADGEGSFLLTSDDGGAEDSHPVFMPDGSSIAFVSNRASDNFQIYLVDRRGNAPQRLTQGVFDVLSLDFRPELALRLRQG